MRPMQMGLLQMELMDARGQLSNTKQRADNAELAAGVHGGASKLVTCTMMKSPCSPHNAELAAGAMWGCIQTCESRSVQAPSSKTMQDW